MQQRLMADELYIAHKTQKLYIENRVYGKHIHTSLSVDGPADWAHVTDARMTSNINHCVHSANSVD